MIYLDHHAASPPCEQALAAMEAARESAWANPASVHGAGRAARALLERAREQIAAAIGASPAEVVLTSGGTEACNLALLGMRPERIVTTAIEHPAVARCIDRHESRGVPVERLPILAGSAPAIAPRPGTLLALASVNHETGTILPASELAAEARAAEAVTFVDATQHAGKLALDVGSLGADLVAIASHKLGGPAGAGALWIRRDTPCELSAHSLGGGQERGRRPGTPDVLAAVGFGAACTALATRLAEAPRLAALRDRLEASLLADGWVANAADLPRVATVTSLSLRGARGDTLVAALDLEGVCAASGAACSSGLQEPSPVLRAMYPDEPWRAESALRMSFGPQITDSEVNFALEAVRRVAARST
ncbi:MAG: cysteine desulfurase family protein [Myxococcales bacterium]|nr:cysteine desulfurase family protein [Myxococcales bacterium]